MTDPAKDADRLADLPPIKTEREQAMRETIHGQGLSMVAMGNELREKDATIARLTQERDEARRSAEALKPFLQRAADKLCHYATDYPQPDTLAIMNDCDRALAHGHYSDGHICQPTPDDVERAREIVKPWIVPLGLDDIQEPMLVGEIAAALTAARREDAELRALDEAAVVERAMYEVYRLSNKNYTDTDGTQIVVIRRGRLRTIIQGALAARDAANPKDSSQC